MTFERITRMRCNTPGCSRYRDLTEPACGRARDKVKALGWSSKERGAETLDFCSVCTTEEARRKAQEEAEKEAKKAQEKAREATK